MKEPLQKEIERKGKAGGSPETTVPQIHWDDSQMESSYANVVNAQSSREERPRPLYVDALEIGLGRVVAVKRSDVDDRVAALDGMVEPVAVEEIDALVSHLGALLAQLARDVAPDEARRA